ncbi:MAG: alpha-amylase [Bacteroidetes bacterium]|nr:alpha-amylase [Bacteroidota bacterium]
MIKRSLVIVSIIFHLVFAENVFAQQTDIFGLATPIELNPDSTIVFLEDYFNDTNAVTEIITPDYLSIVRNADNTILIINTNKTILPIGKIDFVAGTQRYSILVKQSKKKSFDFQFNPMDSIYNTVTIVGDMNAWNPTATPLEFKNGLWHTTLVLNPGRYACQIVADGNWMLDPNNKDVMPNGMGGYNTILTIPGTNHDSIPFITTRNTTGKNIFITAENNVKQWFVLWENTAINYSVDEKGILKITIPPQATTVKRSHIRVYAYNNFGESNDILIPLENGVVIQDATLLDRNDLQKTIMYFVFVDRFMNGDTTNDKKVDDARVEAKANYYGGDLAGIEQKINTHYFQDLGFNALWISPVNQNPWGAYQEYPEPRRWFTGYHGYWPISLSQVDMRFGTNALFKSLVSDAHNNDMNVYLDYVSNHIHIEHPLWKEHPEWFSPLVLPDGRNNLRLWDEYRLTTWFEPYMPSFDHSQPIVANAVADSAMFWITEFNLDGFRHDATKHIEIEYWRLLTRRIKEEIEVPQQRIIYQIGESFGSRELIGSYLGSGLLNAQFDFNTYFDSRSAFAIDDVSFEMMETSLQTTFDYYGYHHTMGNISGNHDLPRFISYAGKGLQWDEDEKEAGWSRDIEVEDLIGYNKLKMLHAFNATIPGIPITYYGDEIGMPGAGDPDNRRMMRFDSLSEDELDMRNTVKKLNEIRSANMALLYGDFKNISVTNEVWSYTRNYFENTVYVYFNKSSKTIYIKLNDTIIKEKYAVQFGSEIMAADVNDVLVLNPYSFEIITMNKTLDK